MIANRFASLQDEVPEEIEEVQPQAKPAPSSSKPVSAPTKSVAPAASKPAPAAAAGSAPQAKPTAASAPKSTPSTTAQKAAPRAAPQPSASEASSNNARPVGDDRNPRADQRGEGDRSRGSGSRRGRGGFAGDGAKREYDRRGAPRKEGEKRETNGPGNWGKTSLNPESNSEDAPPAAAPAPMTETTPVETVEGKTESSTPVPEKEKEEEKVLSLEEYKALKPLANVQLPSLRLAGEGTDPSQWVNTTALVKNDSDFFVGKTSAEKKGKIATKERKVVETIEVQPVPYQPPRDEFSRGGRGRGGPNRSDYRKRENNNVVPGPPQKTDENFPSLSGK